MGLNKKKTISLKSAINSPTKVRKEIVSPQCLLSTAAMKPCSFG